MRRKQPHHLVIEKIGGEDLTEMGRDDDVPTLIATADIIRRAYARIAALHDSPFERGQGTTKTLYILEQEHRRLFEYVSGTLLLSGRTLTLKGGG